MSTRAPHKTSRNKAPTQVDQGMESWLTLKSIDIFNIGCPCNGWLTAVKTMFPLTSFNQWIDNLKETIFVHRTVQNKSKNMLVKSDLSLLCLFPLQLIYYRSSFGIVLSGNSTRLQHCFLDYLVEKRSLLTQLVKNFTKTLPVSKKRTTRDADGFLVYMAPIAFSYSFNVGFHGF